MTPPPEDVEVVLVEGDVRRSAAYAIRVAVFVNEQGVPAELELDEDDESATHVLLLVGGDPAATGRLVVEEPGYEGVDPAFGAVAHLGRIAVQRRHRGRGHGATVVRALEDRAVDAGLKVAYLGAQTYAVPFYERLGYRPYGPVFVEAAIDHRHMTTPLG